MLFERSSPGSCFMTPPPPSWKSRPSRSSPTVPLSERKRSPASASANRGDLFHVIHKVPAGDSPYVKAKQVQLVDKDPGRAISMFWAAINAGDRVDSALKDMALVMKQLNRSDEAIEAIKSFRHLCPSESQDSLDNILVELYKRSGRADEEIAMLHHKLKQIEDGVTFVGRTTKQARSQGKKIQVTAEQEISRILGNLAWAYLQKGDYKTAEEHYRKALSFEVDRNKQCNLAVCLMHMNRITEAKFLLQAVSTATKNRKMDDSFVKSFERASQMLSETESSSSVDPVKEKEGKFNDTQRSLISKTSTNSKESIVRTMSQCSPQSWPVDELKKDNNVGSSSGKISDIVKSRTENWSVTSEAEVSHVRRKLYEPSDHVRRDQKVLYTKPKRCSWGFNNGYQRESWGDVHSDPRPSFGSPHNDKYDIMLPGSTKDDSSSPANGSWRASKLDGGVKEFAISVHTDQNQGSEICLSDSTVDNCFGNDKSVENLVNLDQLASGNRKPVQKKSWADIVEEEEEEENEGQELFCGRYTHFDGQDNSEVFNDENENSNINYQHPWPHSHTECLSKKLESLEQREGYNAPWNLSLSRNQTVRRSLCFNPELTPTSTYFMGTSKSPKKASNLESRRMLAKERDSLSGENKPARRNRLQVFQDITPETP